LAFVNLPDRTITEVGGEEAGGFLDNILTCKVLGLESGTASFGALLTPQGKILFDFFLIKTTDGYWLDTPSDLADDFLKRLMFYRLRAKIDLSKRETVKVAASLNGTPSDRALSVVDPRHEDMGIRIYSENTADENEGQYLDHRIKLGIPEGGKDFQYGNAYPHETLMDQFGGVDFKKGCYVGQEVVSRMQHRGTAKKRIIRVHADADLPETGTDILADGKSAGILGSVTGNSGLALLRLDRVCEAEAVEAAGIAIRAEIPEWAHFTWPEPR